jgi:putative phage-type endonuclease
MNAIIAPEALVMNAPSAQWLEERKTYLGGTDIAAILGLHPYISAAQVWRRKKGFEGETALNQAMVHGQNLEGYVATCYGNVTGRKLEKSRLYRDPEIPFFAANPDFEVIGESRLLECKTAGYFAGQIFGAETDAVPDQYLVQCMWQMAVTGAQAVDLAVLIDGNDFRIYPIERDQELINTLRDKAFKWWMTYIEADNPPPISGMQADTDWVKSSYPQSYEEELNATPDIDDLCEQLREVKAGLRSIEERKSQIENDIKLYMETAGTLQSTVGTVTWRTNKAGSRVFKCNFKEVSKL